MVASANSLQRVRISTCDAFPDDKESFTWDTLKGLDDFKRKVDELDCDDKAGLITYVSLPSFHLLYTL
jgi:hypothetical protein